MRDHSEFDFPPHESRSNDQVRDDLNHPIVAARKIGQVPVDRGNGEDVGDQIIEALHQSRFLLAFNAGHHHRFSVFAHMHEAGPEARFLVESLIVQADERAPQNDRHVGAASRI
ncbi:hypothetical protein D9M72_542700 [compost metagenome]